MGSPSAWAASRRSSFDRYPVPAAVCRSENDNGRPDARIISRRVSPSLRSLKSDTTWSTPRPVSPMARAMPTSSSRAAVRVGVGSPRLVRWLSVREVVNPRAPARTPAAAMAPISAISAAVAGSRSAPR